MSSEPPSKDHPDASPPSKEQSGWLDNLAQRSSGLPQFNRSPPPPEKPPEKSPWTYAGIGLQFAFTTAIFTGMGLYVDYRFHTSPWGTVGLTLLGVTGGMYLLIKEALKANAEPPESPPNKRPKDGP